ncbi:MAG: hypothetical protein R2762_13220 [Bryobacteraceae bacterium]
MTKVAVAATQPLTIFASTGRGLLRSIDGGLRYEPVALKAAGRRQPLITAIVVLPKSPNTVFAGTEAEDGAVWKSSDGGATWAVANKGLPEAAATVELLQWVESNQALYVRLGGQLFKSVDGAETWTLRGDLPPQISAFAISPSQPRWMYAAQSSGGLYRSADEGETWTINRNTVAGISGTTVVTHMMVDPTNPSVGYLAASGAGAGTGNGIYKSGDLIQEEGWAFAIIEATRERLRPLRLYFNGIGGLFATSRVRGEIYRNRCALVSNASEASVRCSDPSIGFDRICVTPDRGSPPGGCVSSNAVLDLAVDPTQREILWAGATNGLFQSRPSAVTGIGSEWSSRYGFAKATLAAPEFPYSFRLPAGEPGHLRFTIAAAETNDWRLPVKVTKGNEEWLVVSPAVEQAPAPATIEVRTAGLAPGVYESKIEIAAADAVNSPLEIPVRLEVLEPAVPTYTASKVVGLGVPGNFGDNGQAERAAIGEVDSLAVDAAGNLFLSDLTYNVVRKVEASGTIRRWAGTGQAGVTGDDGPPNLAALRRPRGLATDAEGNLYIADGEGRRVRRVNAAGDTITLRSNVGENLRGIASDAGGTVYLPVPSVHALVRIAPGGQLTVVAGTGVADFRGDGFDARSARLAAPVDAAVDAAGNIYIADTENNRIRKIDTNGVIRTIAGSGLVGFQGDASKATEAAIELPMGITVDAGGNVFFAETEGHRIRMITASGALRTIAGTGAPGVSDLGAATPANRAPLRGPSDVAAGPNGAIYVADSLNYRIVKLMPVPVEIVPELSAAPIVNSVDGRPALSPGSLFRISGKDLATAASAEPPYPLTLGDAQVFINGVAAPLAMTGTSEIAGQIPYEVAPGEATLRVAFKGKSSGEAIFPLQSTAPALLTNGPDRVMAILSDGSVASADNAAASGSEIRVFVTGQGSVDPPAPSGSAAPAELFSRPTAVVKAWIGATEAVVADTILLPGFAGLAEVRLLVPESVEEGEHEVTIAIGDAESLKPKLRVKR